MTAFVRVAMVGALALVGMLGVASSRAADTATEAPKPGPLAFTVKTIDGKDVPLSQYAGKVILIVNVASRCGNTPVCPSLKF